MASDESWSAGAPLLGMRVRGVGLSRHVARACLWGLPFLAVVAVVAFDVVVGTPPGGVPRLSGRLGVVGAGPIVFLCVMWLGFGLVCVVVAALTLRSFGRPLTTRRTDR